MIRKPPLASDTSTLRDRAEAELKILGAKNRRPSRAAKLPRPVETRLGGRRANSIQATPVVDAERALHELQVHQLELQMQNSELQESRDRIETLLEKYTDLYDFAPVAYFSLDDQGVILEVNLTGAALLGVDRSRLIKRRLSGFMAPASQSAYLAFLKRVFAGTGQSDCDLAMVKADDVGFWARFRGTSAISLHEPQNWCRMSVLDITSFKLAEDIVRRNEALFSALIQQAPMGVYVVDEQLRLYQFNTTAQRIFRKIHPLLGRSFKEIIHLIWSAKIANAIMEHFQHTLKTGKSYIATDFSENRQDSAIKESYEWQIERVTLPTGHHGVACFFNNVTERKHLEATQRRLEVLAASNQKLEQEIVRRLAGEEALKKSEEHQRKMLEESLRMQEQLRQLTRQVLLVQEEERKNISRELHDVIAQTLTGINIRLAALKAGAAANTKDLQQKITSTQRLVEESIEVVHRFARELRPAVLDDLGLIPALHSFLKSFTERTGIRAHLKAFAAVELLDTERRTVLFRVAQEALTNVARHARARRVEVSLEKLPDGLRMKVHDDGKSFNVERILDAKGGKRLGLLGMRERVERVGGHFDVESAPGKGTTLVARVPFRGPASEGNGS